MELIAAFFVAALILNLVSGTLQVGMAIRASRFEMADRPSLKPVALCATLAAARDYAAVLWRQFTKRVLWSGISDKNSGRVQKCAAQAANREGTYV